MNSHNPFPRSENEFERALERSMQNWARRQTPPKYTRPRLMNAAAATTFKKRGFTLMVHKVRGHLKTLIWRPNTDYASRLFSRAMLNAFECEMAVLRVVS